MIRLTSKLVQCKQWILSVVIVCLYYSNKKLHSKVVNSSFWYRIYYKYTDKHKTDLKRTTESVLEIRKKSIGR